MSGPEALAPTRLTPAYVFFASEADSSYITGEVITLLGGQTTAGIHQPTNDDRSLAYMAGQGGPKTLPAA